MTEFYYISTGGGSKIYTLRFHYQESGYNGELVERDQYVKNLSIDPETALEKAREYVGDGVLKGDVNFDLNEYKNRGDNFVWDGETLCYGIKYHGDKISDIAKDEFGIVYLVESYGFPSNPRKGDIECQKYVDSLPEVLEYNRLLKEKSDKLRKESKKLTKRMEKSDWVGEVGEKIEVDVTVTAVFDVHSDWGSNLCVKMVDKHHNLYITYTTSKHFYGYMEYGEIVDTHVEGVKRDDKIKISGMVKKHNTSQERIYLSDNSFDTVPDVKNTQLTRIKKGYK